MGKVDAKCFKTPNISQYLSTLPIYRFRSCFLLTHFFTEAILSGNLRGLELPEIAFHVQH